ncbi:unnamed protein product [Tetraodon nigroviridis]|uniref:(spotted green pufferfish) hypothetical protein n=1 Tax=Tetraodon nigroviridis TaxID=99883 RepID=Q4SHP2_TETNG|nr:unnamed protein product [Tetraodon nigroviridis]
MAALPAASTHLCSMLTQPLQPGSNPASFPPDEEENKGKLEKDGQRREGEKEKRKAGEEVSGGGGGGGCTIVSCLMKALDLPQTDKGWLHSPKLETQRR